MICLYFIFDIGDDAYVCLSLCIFYTIFQKVCSAQFAAECPVDPWARSVGMASDPLTVTSPALSCQPGRWLRQPVPRKLAPSHFYFSTKWNGKTFIQQIHNCSEAFIMATIYRTKVLVF